MAKRFRVVGVNKIFIEDASTTEAGLMSAADKSKLNAFSITAAETDVVAFAEGAIPFVAGDVFTATLTTSADYADDGSMGAGALVEVQDS